MSTVNTPSVIKPEYSKGAGGPYFPTNSTVQNQSANTTAGNTMIFPTVTAFPAAPQNGTVVWRIDLGHLYGFYQGAWSQL
jgi:hypothetical protein